MKKSCQLRILLDKSFVKLARKVRLIVLCTLHAFKKPSKQTNYSISNIYEYQIQHYTKLKYYIII